MVKKKKQTHYIDNAEFEKVIKGYLKNPKKYEERLIQLLDLLITNILMSFKFNVDFDDAKQECFLLAFKTLKNFNPENGAAFNYFTTVIVNNLKLIFTKNKKYRQKIQKYQSLMEERFGEEFTTMPANQKNDK
jgi:DNA-directed RNA polymerase specialized sigma subunit